MATIELSLPDDLAREATNAGLLNSPRLEQWLREQLKQQGIDKPSAAIAHMDAAEPVIQEDSLQTRRLEAMERLGRLAIDFKGKPMDDREAANARYRSPISRYQHFINWPGNY